MTDSENKALTDEQIAKEARLNTMVDVLTEQFPENKVERFGSYIYVTSTSDSFLGSALTKINAVSTLFGGAGYYITASVTKGLQAVLF